MNRPKVTFENHEAVYNFYREYRPHPRTSAFLYGALGNVFRPKVTYGGDSQEQIANIFDSGRTVILASNHLKAIDPCNIAALVNREELLHPIAKNGSIPSKKSLFKYAGVRQAIDGLGAFPVYRDEDAKAEKNKNGGKSLPMRAILDEFIDTAIARLDSGQHMAMFAEGTRNKGDITKLQPLFSGLGKMVCGVSKVEQPAIIPMALHYGTGPHDATITPHVQIGEPHIELFSHRKEVMAWLAPALQDCVDASTA